MPWITSSANAGSPTIQVGFETTALLSASPGPGNVYDSPVLSYAEGAQSQVQTEVLSDTNGTMLFRFYADDAGTDLIRSLTVPYVAADGYRQFGTSTFGRSVRYRFTNDGAGQSDFYFATKLVRGAVSPQILAVDAFVSPAMLSSLQRSVLVGQDGAGNFANVTTVQTTNDAGTYESLQVATGARPSELTGRTAISITVDGVTADTLLHTTPGGKTTYITDALLTVSNAASGAVGSVKLRDGTTVAGAVVLPILTDEAPGSGTATTTVAHAFLEPVAFDTGIFLEEAAGTLTISGILLGYEE